MSNILIGFMSGLVVGGALAAYFLSIWTKLIVQKRWDRLLEESPQFHEGQYAAFEYCRDLVTEYDNPETLQDWLLDLMAEKALKAENLLQYKDDRAKSLGTEDALAELTNKEGK